MMDQHHYGWQRRRGKWGGHRHGARNRRYFEHVEGDETRASSSGKLQYLNKYVTASHTVFSGANAYVQPSQQQVVAESSTLLLSSSEAAAPSPGKPMF